jgi:hypothetical protein
MGESMSEASGTATIVDDYRPFHRTSANTVWNWAFNMRDTCYKDILSVFESKRIKALVTKSENGQYPPFIRIEAWKPVPGAGAMAADSRLRSTVELQFKAMPYHEHSVVTTARATVAGRSIAIADRPNFRSSDAVEWALYGVGAGGKPKSHSPWLDFLVNMLLSLIPFASGRHSNKVDPRFKNAFPFSAAAVSGLIGLWLGGSGFLQLQTAGYYGDRSMPTVMLLLGIALVGVSIVLASRRRRAISVIERPTIPPRYLIMLDSWHAVIPDLGPMATGLLNEIFSKLSGVAEAGVTAEIERYGYRTPNGFDERDRIVVSKGQGVAHIHVYSFGKDLFVGWDSYVNWAQWQETAAISVRRQGGARTEYRGLQPGVYIPNQFDLIDLNSLAELVHRDVTRVVKGAMEEHKIDQEIDFSIIRGDRERVLDSDNFDRRNKQSERQGRTGTRRWRIS